MQNKEPGNGSLTFSLNNSKLTARKLILVTRQYSISLVQHITLGTNSMSHKQWLGLLFLKQVTQ